MYGGEPPGHSLLVVMEEGLEMGGVLERIADELLLKLGIAVSPRTVRCYLSRATLIGTIRVFYKPAAIHEISATLDRALGRSRSRERSD